MSDMVKLTYLEKLKNRRMKLYESLTFSLRELLLIIHMKTPKFSSFKIIYLQNALLVKDCFDEQLSKALINYFNKTNTQHEHSTRSASRNCVFVPNICTDTHCKNLIRNLQKYGMNYNVPLISTY